KFITKFIMIEKKVITKPIDFGILNQLSIDFNTRFVPQIESYAEQAFWSQYSVQTDEPTHSGTTIVEVPKELPKVSMRDTVSSSESAPTFAELFETNKLKAQIQEKDTVILKLKEKIKSSSGDLKERKVNVVLLVSKLRKNRTAHIDYIRHTQEEAATLRELVESERLLSPLNTSLAYALAVTPKNQTKQIRRTAQITKSEKTSVATSPSLNIDSNTPVLSSTGVTLVSSASGSKSQDNTKKNRIRRTQKKAKETELEDYLRKVKSSLNKASVVDSRATSSVIKSVSNVNSNLRCASCNGCLFSDNHDACVVEYINYVNASRKSKSVKTPVKRNVWKSTGKVFKTVGYKWKLTGRTFTLVGNVFPLTRIATATIVPPRELIPIVKSTDKPVVTLVYTRKPKAKHVPNKMEPNKSWGSSSNISTPITDCRLSKSSFGLGHNIFSVGQFCDSDLEVAFHQHTCFIRNLEGVDLLTVRCIQTDNRTEFVNKTLRDYYEEVGISHETSVARSSQ
nr:integrase, catalytic region, zinc finger, CCHC-type, peptidase aspartic, catalytic [Tanacetum cinerariifolium]